MANIERWNPYEELQRMRDDLARFFAPFGSALTQGAVGSWSPRVDVRETPMEFIVSAEVPGVDPTQLEVSLTEDSLTLQGRVDEEHRNEEGEFQRIERHYGSFQRTIPFPSSVRHEQAKADCRNGVLEIRVPKADPMHGKVTRLQIGGDSGTSNRTRPDNQPPMQQ